MTRSNWVLSPRWRAQVRLSFRDARPVIFEPGCLTVLTRGVLRLEALAAAELPSVLRTPQTLGFHAFAGQP